jgi:catechol 2,3-dioxygenase-like lactoylglutathione lyase family enzyme
VENLNLGAKTRAVVDRMEHVHLSVADVSRSVDFYRRAFGFDVRWEESGPDGRCAHVGTDRFYVALSEDGALAAAGGTEGASILHFAFTTEDLEAFRRRLAERGIEAGELYRRKEGDAVYIYDPDGHEIEVVGYRREYTYR